MKDNILIIFIKRMEKLGIKVQLSSNYPWIYIDEINGKRIHPDDYFLGNHGFTIAFHSIKNDTDINITDISKIFKLIRKYR